MKHYVLSGKVSKVLYDDILSNLDSGTNFKITCGYGLSNEEINKIAAFGIPIHIRGEIWNDDLKNTVEQLLLNSAEEVLIEFVVSKNSIKRLNDVIIELSENSKIFGAKLLLREWVLEFLKLDDKEWNKLIVTCMDHDITLVWDPDMFAATHRYEEFLKDIS